MDTADRAYAIYCSIARTCLNREPIPRERWDRIPTRSYMRSSMLHDDGQWDCDRDREGDAQ